MNPMRELKISKVTVNMGIGEGGEKLEKAEALMEELTDQTPVRTFAKVSNQTFGIRTGLPIACKVTLRREKADNFLKNALDAVDHHLKRSSFDRQGNVAFGIHEHINIPGVKYDPQVGIFGMDVLVTVERPGYRVKYRKTQRTKPSRKHLVTPEDSMAFMKKLGATIVEE
jgi:large subunit ribosomal protein L5